MAKSISSVMLFLCTGKSYRFRLTYRVGDRTNREDHVVEVITCATCIPPSVVMTTRGVIVNPSNKVLLEAKVWSDIGATYQWSVEEGFDQGK